MIQLNLTVKSRKGESSLAFPVYRIVNAGYTSRDKQALQKHIEELRQKGVPAPRTIPTLYPVASYLIVTDGTVEVVEERNSGEVEFVLLLNEHELLIGVGSDHTDREMETISILKAKQACPNVMSSTVWPYKELEDHWDELILRSWVLKEGKRILYQEGQVSQLMSPEDLILFVKERLVDHNMNNLIIYSGTIPTVTGEIMSGDAFEAELYDPITDDVLQCKYNVRLLDYLTEQ